jgi:Uma2 family endonuclease
MVLQTKPITIDEFRDYVSQSENNDRLFELIDGEIIEVSPGRTSNSGVGHLIVIAVHPFCEQHDVPCYTSGGDGAYDIQGHVVAPDFAFKRTPLSNEYPDPIAPEWAVEIISPTDKPYQIRAKRQIYLRAKILYWELYPESQSIDVYAPGQPQPRTLGINDTLDGGDVLPGFTLPLKKLFKK